MKKLYIGLIIAVLIIAAGGIFMYGQDQVDQNLNKADAIHAQQAKLGDELKALPLDDYDGMIDKLNQMQALGIDEAKALKAADNIFTSDGERQYIDVSLKLIASNERVWDMGIECFGDLKKGDIGSATAMISSMQEQNKLGRELATQKDKLKMQYANIE